MRHCALACIAIAFASGPALAQTASPWSFSGTVGADIPVAGEIHGAATSAPITLSTLNSNLTGTGILRIRGRDYADLYETGARASLEVRYNTSGTSQFFAALSYINAKGSTGNIGCVDITTTAGECNADLFARFSDYRQWGLEVGYRQALGQFAGMTPYFAVRGGLTRTDAITADVSIPNTPLANLRFYDETWAAMIGADIGATMAISPNAAIGGEVGVRYVTKLNEDDSDLNALGLGSLNNSDTARLSVPVSVRLNAAF